MTHSRAVLGTVLLVVHDLRLGMLCGGFEDIKAHAWFQGIDWEKLAASKYKIPCRPPFVSHASSRRAKDRGHCMTEWEKFNAAGGVCDETWPVQGDGIGAAAKAAGIEIVASEYHGPQDCFGGF